MKKTWGFIGAFLFSCTASAGLGQALVQKFVSFEPVPTGEVVRACGAARGELIFSVLYPEGPYQYVPVHTFCRLDPNRPDPKCLAQTELREADREGKRGYIQVLLGFQASSFQPLQNPRECVGALKAHNKALQVYKSSDDDVARRAGMVLDALEANLR